VAAGAARPPPQRAPVQPSTIGRDRAPPPRRVCPLPTRIALYSSLATPSVANMALRRGGP
jgi:hypothetical protein